MISFLALNFLSFLKMTLPYLPDDCIYYILKYLKNYRYRSTLFNCLLVNRFWCKAAVPLLYADPFNKMIIRHSNIILTLILCFNKTEILQLKNLLKLLNIDSIYNISDINEEYKSLFEYPKYFENYNYSVVGGKVKEWLKLYQLHDDDNENFISTFHQLILHKCINIKQLYIPVYNEIYKYFNIQPFTKLNSLRLVNHSVKIGTEFLSNAENIYLNLKKLEISLYQSNNFTNTAKENLYKIIQKQNDLKVFRLSHHCFSFNDDILNNVFLSLEFQKRSLICIEFHCIDFKNISFKNLLNLYNLKYLKFSNCRGLSLDKCKVFEFSSFKLEMLILVHHDTWNNNSAIPLMTKYLGASLKELRLIESLKTPNFENNLLKYCPNLITLEIKVTSNIDSSLFSFLKDLKIRILDIYYYYFDYYDLNDSGDSIDTKSLANNLPTSVKQVSIRCNDRFLNLYKKFLENCHNHLETINLADNIRLDLLEIILNYIERSNNSLKCLGVINPEEVLNDEESKLLNQIRAKGVKVENFFSIYDKCDFFKI